MVDCWIKIPSYRWRTVHKSIFATNRNKSDCYTTYLISNMT